jgi:drug/metabolite transporter (DMT)-like permease
VGFAGVALVVSSGHGKGEVHCPGIVLVALASVSYAIATAMAKTQLKGFDPLGLATTQLTLAILLMLPVAAIGPRPSGITLQSVLAVGALGVFGTGIAYLLYYGMLARISAIQVQAVTYVLPVWGLFWGALAGEAVGVLSIAGVAIVLAGLMLLRAPGRPVSSEKLREPAA